MQNQINKLPISKDVNLSKSIWNINGDKNLILFK